MAERVVVAMSGGVDSSVSAALLVQAGYDVIGVAMRLWNAPASNGRASGCCSLDDFLDARRVAHRLDIPFYVMDFQSDFERSVIRPFAEEYAGGRTPNPCVRCNQHVKFDSFWHRARELGATAMATGHYARVLGGGDGDWRLARGRDTEKDQSYFLFSMPRAMLGHTLFPVGDLTKGHVRRLAADAGLAVAQKPDSQEVCFAPGREHVSFVASYLGAERPRRGPVVDEDGGLVGAHDGVHTVTIGQRRGLRLQTGSRRYVTAIDAASGTVRVGAEEALEATGLEATGVNWLVPRPPIPGTPLRMKIRSRHAGVKVRILESQDLRFVVRAEEALRAVTPGQAAVLYDGDHVVGGGWIARTIRRDE